MIVGLLATGGVDGVERSKRVPGLMQKLRQQGENQRHPAIHYEHLQQSTQTATFRAFRFETGCRLFLYLSRVTPEDKFIVDYSIRYAAVRVRVPGRSAMLR